ncbi:hypothetical protein LDG_6826 [Legionella drancourtii LLAP12]|uniref:Uncharacterized protein n=1 Tax=Legionella drancourtii LLAP12 TaxID=658187 RepID=G9ENK2_9GAMM|nr:hypothetical protein LDG_6826 [Legionella drancourtii LLAP12]
MAPLVPPLLQNMQSNLVDNISLLLGNYWRSIDSIIGNHIALILIS